MTVAAGTTAHDGHRGQVEKLARRGAASVLGAACSAVFGVALVLVLTNGVPATVAGTLFAATAMFLIVESVALLGTDTGLVRWLPAQLAAGRGADVRRTLAIAAMPVVALALVLAVVGYVVAPDAAPYLVGPAAADTMTAMLRALALALPVAAAHDVLLAATRGAGSVAPTVVVDSIGRTGLQVLLVLAALWAGGDAATLALAWSLPYLAGLLASAAWLAALVRGQRPAHPPTPWNVLLREFWSYTSARSIARITQTALKRSDIVLVASLASPAEAALYTAATRFIVLGQLFVQAVQQALSPHLSSLFAQGDTGAATAVFQAAGRWSVLAAWPLYLVVAGSAPILMDVFGEGYDGATQVVVILSLTMLLATACGPVDSVLLMAGRSWLSLRNSVVALLVNIGLNLVLIPLDGIRGAAVSWSVAIVVRNVLPLVQVRRDLQAWPVTRPTVRAAVAAVVTLGTADAVLLATDLARAWDVTVLLTGSAVYTAAIWRWRDRLDLGVFGAALKRGSPLARPAPRGSRPVGGGPGRP